MRWSSFWKYGNSKPDFKTVQSEITKKIQDLNNIISTNNLEFEQEILHIWRNYLFQNLALATSIGGSVTVNQAEDGNRQFNMPMMPVIDATRHLLYTALYHYRRGMYKDAISLLQEAKIKLQHPQLEYMWTGDVEKYRAAGGEQKTFTQMVKEIFAWPVELKTGVTIPELTLEHQAATNHSTDQIAVPPLVFINYMCILCYHHMVMVHEAQSVLQELSILIQYDNGYHIPESCEAISWQMLGICQEMSGYYKGAYQAYCNAIQQKVVQNTICILDENFSHYT